MSLLHCTHDHRPPTPGLPSTELCSCYTAPMTTAHQLQDCTQDHRPPTPGLLSAEQCSCYTAPMTTAHQLQDCSLQSYVPVTLHPGPPPPTPGLHQDHLPPTPGLLSAELCSCYTAPMTTAHQLQDCSLQSNVPVTLHP